MRVYIYIYVCIAGVLMLCVVFFIVKCYYRCSCVMFSWLVCVSLYIITEKVILSR